jgi:hypothetical protein
VNTRGNDVRSREPNMQEGPSQQQFNLSTQPSAVHSLQSRHKGPQS